MCVTDLATAPARARYWPRMLRLGCYAACGTELAGATAWRPPCSTPRPTAASSSAGTSLSAPKSSPQRFCAEITGKGCVGVRGL
eukprot:3939196-Rhodomonas_salina.1